MSAEPISDNIAANGERRFGENLTFAQLNEKNRYISIDVIKSIFDKINIGDATVNDIATYQQAFVHRSYVKKRVLRPDDDGVMPFQTASNEVLEFEGDSILGSYVARYLHHRYPKEAEGRLTTLKSKLVRTESLAKFAEFLGFDRYLVISKMLEEKGGRGNPKLLENTFEAFVGAIYHDHGGFENSPKSMELAERFVRGVMESTVNFAEVNAVNDNYKDQLMRCFHQVFNGRHAVYRLLETSGPTNNCVFTCGVVHPLYPEVVVSKGTARKKPLAEQIAAKEALAKINEIVDYKPANAGNKGNSDSDSYGD